MAEESPANDLGGVRIRQPEHIHQTLAQLQEEKWSLSRIIPRALHKIWEALVGFANLRKWVTGKLIEQHAATEQLDIHTREGSIEQPEAEGEGEASTSAPRATVPSVGGELNLSRSGSSSSSNQCSPRSVLDENIDDSLCDQLERAVADAENAIRALEEKYSLDAVQRAQVLYTAEVKQKREIEQKLAEEEEAHEKTKRDLGIALEQNASLESLYTEEVKQKSDTEQKLAEKEEAFEKMKRERDEVTNKLLVALQQKLSLKSRLEQKLAKEEEAREKMKRERDEALEQKASLEKRMRHGETSSTSSIPRLYSEISFLEIMEATKNLDPSLKIGEGRYGTVYKGTLRHTQVAIKMPGPHSKQGSSEFQNEVEVLSRVRHPNIVTHIGACPEARALVYEFLPNGSLEDRLSCLGNSQPLSWKTRVRIATELCFALIFLHSSKPHSIVHGDIKPTNILLDAHFVTKLGDFGIRRLLHRCQSSSNRATLSYQTDLKGTFAYTDPELLFVELSPKSDVYSFGRVLLKLLTGRCVSGLIEELQYALGKGNLKAILDPSAGDWPSLLTEQLAHLVLRCCDLNGKNRPTSSEVWRTLKPMRILCGGSPSAQMGDGDQSQPPPYFICPILLDVMQDPHFAADGFTYEAEALRGWLESGHNTSPMTNLRLAHTGIIPNCALRSSIQEWLQNRPS